MAVMLERWNDDKMDALAAKVDDHGRQLSEIRLELREQRKEMKGGFEKLDGRFEKLDGRFEKLDGRFEKLGERLEKIQRTMLWAAVTIIVALLGSGSAIIAALINSSHP